MEELNSIDFGEEDAFQKLTEQLEKYDQKFKDKYAKQTPNELAEIYKEDQTRIPVPEEGSEIEQYLKTTFIADNRQFGHYQNLMRQARVPEYQPPPPPPPPKIIEDNILNEFIPICQNFQEQNANSKQYNQAVIKKQKYGAVMDNGYDMFHLNQMGLIKNMVPPPEIPPTAEEDFNKKLQENIDRLGGYPDTIQGMKLNENEVNHFYAYKIQAEDEQKEQREQQIESCISCDMRNKLELTKQQPNNEVKFCQEQQTINVELPQRKQIDKKLVSVQESRALREQKLKELQQLN